MNDPSNDIILLQELLELELPLSFRKFLEYYDDEVDGLPIPLLGFAVSLDDDSIWGATEFLRAARPELENRFVVILPLNPWSICLDLSNDAVEDAPVVQIDLSQESEPQIVCTSFVEFLRLLHESPHLVLPSGSSVKHPVDDYWFQQGLERLGQHLENLSFSYDHKNGGQLPRSHVWRPYRFCIQDVIFGITVVKHDRKYNRLEVDLFLTASIPEYPPESGCRALGLILLSDAYKTGGSMEIRFTRQVEGGRIPGELVSLAASLQIPLKHIREGIISPPEAKQLYLALTGFSAITRNKILLLEQSSTLSSASICYAVHHGVWSIPELEVILFGSKFPNSILRGSLPAENWHLFNYDLAHACNALMGGYLDIQLAKSEINNADGSVTELEDAGQSLEIQFDADNFCKIFRLDDAGDSVRIPWITGCDEEPVLTGGHRLLTLLRARSIDEIRDFIFQDLSDAMLLRHDYAAPGDIVCVMVPADFLRLAPELRAEILDRFRREHVGLMLCPDFLSQIDQEVRQRFEAIKVIRQ